MRRLLTRKGDAGARDERPPSNLNAVDSRNGAEHDVVAEPAVRKSAFFVRHAHLAVFAVA